MKNEEEIKKELLRSIKNEVRNDAMIVTIFGVVALFALVGSFSIMEISLWGRILMIVVPLTISGISWSRYYANSEIEDIHELDIVKRYGILGVVECVNASELLRFNGMDLWGDHFKVSPKWIWRSGGYGIRDIIRLDDISNVYVEKIVQNGFTTISVVLKCYHLSGTIQIFIPKWGLFDPGREGRANLLANFILSNAPNASAGYRAEIKPKIHNFDDDK